MNDYDYQNDVKRQTVNSLINSDQLQQLRKNSINFEKNLDLINSIIDSNSRQLEKKLSFEISNNDDSLNYKPNLNPPIPAKPSNSGNPAIPANASKQNNQQGKLSHKPSDGSSKSHKLSLLEDNHQPKENPKKEVLETSKNESAIKLTEHIETEAFLIGRDDPKKNLKKVSTKNSKQFDEREIDSCYSKSIKSVLSDKSGSQFESKNNTLTSNKKGILKKETSKSFEEDNNRSITSIGNKMNTLNDEPKFRYLKRKEKIVSNVEF